LPQPADLAFKAYEIEELADVYFFRPLGMVFARLARAMGVTPTAVTVIGSAVGVAGGALLYDDRLALLAFALIIFHSVLDSSDGQLARMTGQTSELGRLLDGVGGLVTYVAIFLAILAETKGHPGRVSSFPLAVVAAISTVFHAQMYDYHRTSYGNCAIKGVVEPSRGNDADRPGMLRVYEGMERALAGAHEGVVAALGRRATAGAVRDDDRARYRACFYWPVRGWNLMGDNTRFYAIGVLAVVHRLDWFFPFVIVPMNTACLALWLWQARADRRFLAGL
jgi:phosphatidylglycerophosphate synthase